MLVTIHLMNGSSFQMSNVDFVSAGGDHEIESYELECSTRVQCSPAVSVLGDRPQGLTYP